jgi:hypothetical protein
LALPCAADTRVDDRAEVPDSVPSDTLPLAREPRDSLLFDGLLTPWDGPEDVSPHSRPKNFLAKNPLYTPPQLFDRSRVLFLLTFSPIQTVRKNAFPNGLNRLFCQQNQCPRTVEQLVWGIHEIFREKIFRDRA